jgi:hypothetical protein
MPVLQSGYRAAMGVILDTDGGELMAAALNRTDGARDKRRHANLKEAPSESLLEAGVQVAPY